MIWAYPPFVENPIYYRSIYPSGPMIFEPPRADAARPATSSSSGTALVDVICHSQDAVVIIVVVLARKFCQMLEAGSARTIQISSSVPPVFRIVI